MSRILIHAPTVRLHLPLPPTNTSTIQTDQYPMHGWQPKRMTYQNVTSIRTRPAACHEWSSRSRIARRHPVLVVSDINTNTWCLVIWRSHPSSRTLRETASGYWSASSSCARSLLHSHLVITPYLFLISYPVISYLRHFYSLYSYIQLSSLLCK